MFGRSSRKGGHAGEGSAPVERVHASSHVEAFRRGGVIDAVLENETISEHEVGVLLEELTTLCLEQASSRLAVGLQKVTILTSAGIGLLVQLHKKLSAEGGGLAIYGLNDDLSHLMKLTRMDRLFVIKDTAEQAASALA